MNITGHLQPTGQVGVPYSTAFGVEGGTAPYIYSIVAGTFPTGVSIKALTGVVSGTPTAAGVKAGIKVKVTDALGATATTLAMAVNVT